MTATKETQMPITQTHVPTETDRDQTEIQLLIHVPAGMHHILIRLPNQIDPDEILVDFKDDGLCGVWECGGFYDQSVSVEVVGL